MKRYATGLAALLLLNLLWVMPAARAEGVDLKLPCKAAILVEQETGSVLYESNSSRQLPIASITKVMTLLLTMEAIENGKVTLQDIVPVSEHAYSMGGSQIWLEPGEQFTLDEMIRAICVASANDAAVAVAEYVGGSEPAFVAMMNEKAVALGMENTHFANACGLDTQGHLSTAADVAKMSREILTRYPEIIKYTTIWTDSLRNGATQLVNTNKLLKRYNGITGLKTGTTGLAGVCITASATREGLSLIGVVLGSSSGQERFDAAVALLDYGFAGWKHGAIPQPEGAALALPVRGGQAESVALEYTTPAGTLLKRAETGALRAELSLGGPLTAPVEAGQQVGTVQVYCGDSLLGEYPVKAREAVKRQTVKEIFLQMLCTLAGRQ